VSKGLFLFCRWESRDQDRCNVLPKVTQGDTGNAKNNFQDLRSCPVPTARRLRRSLLPYAVLGTPCENYICKSAFTYIVFQKKKIQST